MKLKTIKSKSEISEDENFDGYLIDANENEARKIIQSLKTIKSTKKIAILGRDDAFNRRAVETLKINFLVSPERGNRRDTLKQRDSGLNHVVAKEAVRNKVTFLIDIAEISNLQKKEKSERISRIIQNIKICRKAKCPIRIWDSSEKFNKVSLAAFGQSLGMSTEQSREL